MDKVVIATVVASFISLALEVVPGLADLWDKVEGKAKAAVVLLLCLAVPFLASGGACFGIDAGLGASCPASPQDVFDALLLGFAAFSASQLVHANAGESLGFARARNKQDADGEDAG